MSAFTQFVQETEMTASQALTNVVSFREAKAKRIKVLAQTWAENTIALGMELKAVRDTFPEAGRQGASFRRPEWSEWCAKTVGFSSNHATKLIRIAETFGTKAGTAIAAGSAELLEFLSRSTVPDSVREEVTERLDRGEVVGKRAAQQIKERHTAPPPEEARKIAKETGKPTLARDGNIYLGATKEQEQQAEARREMVFGVRRAIEALATVGMPPAKFLKQALTHQLWTPEEEHLIDEALDWLTDLKTEWEQR